MVYPVVQRAVAQFYRQDDRWLASGSMRQGFLLDVADVDGRAMILRAFWHDAIGFVVNSARSSIQGGRCREDAGNVLLAHLHSQSRVHKQVGLAVRFRLLP